MLYLFDFLFIVGYIIWKDVSAWVINKNIDIWKIWRKYYLWFEISYIAGGVYFIPHHTMIESCVAFFATLLTKGVHDIIFGNRFELNDD